VLHFYAQDIQFLNNKSTKTYFYMLTFKEKIDKILELKNLSIHALSVESGLKTTLEVAYSKEREMRSASTMRLIRSLRINKDWWDFGTGEVFENSQKRRPNIAGRNEFNFYRKSSIFSREI